MIQYQRNKQFSAHQHPKTKDNKSDPFASLKKKRVACYLFNLLAELIRISNIVFLNYCKSDIAL